MYIFFKSKSNKNFRQRDPYCVTPTAIQSAIRIMADCNCELLFTVCIEALCIQFSRFYHFMSLNKSATSQHWTAHVPRQIFQVILNSHITGCVTDMGFCCERESLIMNVSGLSWLFIQEIGSDEGEDWVSSVTMKGSGVGETLCPICFTMEFYLVIWLSHQDITAR